MVAGSGSQSILPLVRMAAAAAVGLVAGAPVASGVTECSEGSAEGRLLDCHYRHRHLQRRLVAEGSVEAARAAEGKAETVGATAGRATAVAASVAGNWARGAAARGRVAAARAAVARVQRPLRQRRWEDQRSRR